MILDDIKHEIEKAKNIVILTHENPDGDAIGSSLAMYQALKKFDKNADVIIPEYSKTFSFLPYINVLKGESNVEKYDLAIVLDCGDISRLNGFSKYYENAKKTIQIDHHSINNMFCQINYVDPVSPATAQILIMLFDYLNIKITNDMAVCLMTGIITDTGGFKYANTNTDTFEYAARFLAQGINISKIYESVMDAVTISKFELSKRAMSRLELIENGRIAYTYITKKDIIQTRAQMGDYEGIVEQARSIEGVEVAVFIKEIDKGCKVSLRVSNSSKINVADICMVFGGGGHIKAAGCTMLAPIEATKEKVIKEIVRSM